MVQRKRDSRIDIGRPREYDIAKGKKIKTTETSFFFLQKFAKGDRQCRWAGSACSEEKASVCVCV